MKLLALLLIVTNVGCTSEFVHREYEPKSGIVKYSNTSEQSLIDFCSPLTYKVVGITKGMKTMEFYTANDLHVIKDDGQIYVKFVCE